jgi:hypothetical protein
VVRPHSRPSGVELRVANLHRTTNSVLQATVILKNKTSRMLNVVDDSRGNPAFVMETTGTRVWLTDMVNSLKMNIAPGASLTNAVLLTNAPSRFRLKVTLRDLGAEKQVWSVYPILPKRLASKVVEWRRKGWLPEEPASDWIQE